jgi:SAM-dependent methyltransferase
MSLHKHDFIGLCARDMPLWTQLTEVAQSGAPLVTHEAARSGWPQVVTGIAPLALAAARTAAERLEIEHADPFRMLDVGGGAGAFSAIWLALHAGAHACQIDWEDVNAVARAYVAGYGVADRFETRDGDVRAVDFGSGYRFVVMSQLVHFFAADDNRLLFAKAKRALDPGGVLIVADFVLDDDRRGDGMARMFGANMLFATEHGRALVRGEVEEWLGAAGFDEIASEPIAGMPHRLIYAR